MRTRGTGCRGGSSLGASKAATREPVPRTRRDDAADRRIRREESGRSPASAITWLSGVTPGNVKRAVLGHDGHPAAVVMLVGGETHGGGPREGRGQAREGCGGSGRSTGAGVAAAVGA
ncbi:hypothetical protein TPA0910_12810 [Streptomyces hygroscopicus subsp. sporocinereus]|uniref:Uncharacterized protein n=1 Tax=Streptomyces hygroscopicus TaxID=1912 RepID=A0ABQ3TUA6_STRHY|nr:hypothetical protein TPA0910_12810 [Streptomyces hygroscopicus]